MSAENNKLAADVRSINLKMVESERKIRQETNAKMVKMRIDFCAEKSRLLKKHKDEIEKASVTKLWV